MHLPFEIQRVFATPIYMSEVDISGITDGHLDENFQKMTHDTTSVSDNEQILNVPKFEFLRTQIVEHMNHLYYDVYGYSKETYPALSSSWLLLSTPNDMSGMHTHGNSIFSGVVYLRVPKNSGGIRFSRGNSNLTDIMVPKIERQNEFNSKFFSIDAREGMILIFPSSVPHQVLRNRSNEDRVSLSFNFFLKGKFVAPAAYLEIT
jgi:uncharacterized protein (TIGR02466 family)